MKQYHERVIGTGHLAFTAILFAALTALTSCSYDRYDSQTIDGGMAVELTIMTRAITSDTQTYERGSTWENYIDIAGGDYHIYFFTYDPSSPSDESTNNTLIAEFEPQEMTAVEGTTYTQYTLSGEVGDDIAAYSDFKVVVLANWGTYPSVTAGTTTIDALVEGESSTFSAETFFDGVDATQLIPFYGVHEYSGVEWKEGWKTTLEGDISLLRALAKVEVVLSEDSDIEGFDSVVLNRYNSTGYCAPSGVYLKGDYDHDSVWEQDFADAIHLVGNANDTDQSGRTLTLSKTTNDDGREMWVGYLPEYANLTVAGTAAEDYSYIQVNLDGETDNADTRIYFANYTDGVAASTADYDIYRNYLYRFYVTVESEEGYFRVVVNEWDECFDNDFTFDAE